jgi:hypothetical protein
MSHHVSLVTMIFPYVLFLTPVAWAIGAIVEARSK